MSLPLLPSMAGVSRIWRAPPRPEATLVRMVNMTMAEYQVPSLVEVAANIAETVPEKNVPAIAAALLRWLRTYTRFVPDPIGEQQLKSPLYMLALVRQDGLAPGDCVDLAMLGAALAMAVGIPAKFVGEAYAQVPDAPLVHVYAVVQTGPETWVNLDTQRTPAEADSRPTRRVRSSIP